MSFEDQAASFDKRVAIPAEAGERVPAAVADITRLQQGDTLLEIGVGTGILSVPLIRRSIRYIGFDLVPAMLAVFCQKVKETRLHVELLVADSNDRWPAEDASVAVVFSARAIHLIDVGRAVTKTVRVLRPEGGWLILGRMCRPNGSVKPTLRRQVRKLLEEEGYSGRDHGTHVEALFVSGTERVLPKNIADLAYKAWEITRQHIFERWIESTDPANMQPAIPKPMRDAAGLLRSYPPKDLDTARLHRLFAANSVTDTKTENIGTHKHDNCSRKPLHLP